MIAPYPKAEVTLLCNSRKGRETRSCKLVIAFQALQEKLTLKQKQPLHPMISDMESSQGLQTCRSEPFTECCLPFQSALKDSLPWAGDTNVSPHCLSVIPVLLPGDCAAGGSREHGPELREALAQESNEERRHLGRIAGILARSHVLRQQEGKITRIQSNQLWLFE